MKNWYYYWITTIEGIGKAKIRNLLRVLKTPEQVYKANANIYKELPFLSSSDVSKIIESKDEQRIQIQIKNILNQNIQIISIECEEYPYMLKHIEDAPYVIYKKGNINLNKPGIAIVGSRKCSEYGYVMAHNIAKDLASAGILVVSGLAQGIDTAAHKGALQIGDTVAVLGNGSNIYYPRCNHILQKQIEFQGCTLSEYPINTNPYPGFFPLRNRIISGLCNGVLIVEAAEKSGSLITANFALEQGRDVFAVPGNAWSKMSEGTNKIIQSGAKLVISANDIIEEMEQYLPLKVKSLIENKDNFLLNGLAQDERMVYDCLSQEPLYIDEIKYKTTITIATLQYIITSLELKGLIKRLPGQRLIRSE